MSLGSKIRTGAMVSGAISAHRVSRAQQQQAFAQHQQSLAQHAQAEQLARAASAAERQTLIAAQAAAHQRRLEEQTAAQALRAQFAQWRQTPDGRAYEQWRHKATELSDDVLARIRPAANFQPKVAAAHAYDVQQARSAYPGPPVAVPQPRERIVATPGSKPVIIGAVAVGLLVLLPVLSGFLSALVSAIAPQSRGAGDVGSLGALVIAAVICFFGVRWIQRARVARADKERLAATVEYEAAVGRWRDWQAEAAAAKAARVASLGGASENPNDVPEWWEASVSDGGFLPMPEEIEAYEARAMREFPSPNRLPRLQRASFKVFDAVPAGPEVRKALGWYRSQNPTSS